MKPCKMQEVVFEIRINYTIVLANRKRGNGVVVVAGRREGREYAGKNGLKPLRLRVPGLFFLVGGKKMRR